MQYTAPNEPGIYYIVAHSSGDPEATNFATVVVRQVAIGLTPARVKLEDHEKFQFRATIDGSVNHAVAWSISEGAGSDNGTIAQNGEYTAPNEVLGPKTIHVVATSAADPAVQATAEVILSTIETTTVDVEPRVVSLVPGEPVAFHATVANTSSQAVTWTLERIDPLDDFGEATLAGGVLVAGPRPSTFRVRATSVDDQSQWGEAEVTVEDAPALMEGIVYAGTGVTVASNERIWIASLTGHGGTSRTGEGYFRIRTGAPIADKKLVAWVDDGTGVFLPASDQRWGLLNEASVQEIGPNHYRANIELTATHAGAPTSGVPAGPAVMVTPGDGSLLVRFQPLTTGAAWPIDLTGAGDPLLPPNVDEYVIDIDISDTFPNPVKKTVPSTALPMALFTGLPNDTPYFVRATAKRGATPGAATVRPGAVTVAAPTGTKLTATLELGAYAPAASTRAVVMTLDSFFSDQAAFVSFTDLESPFELKNATGSLRLVALFDENDDGVFKKDERLALLPKHPFVATADVSAGTIAVPPPASSVEVWAEDEGLETWCTILLPRTTRASLVRAPLQSNGLPALAVPADIPHGAFGFWPLRGLRLLMTSSSLVGDDQIYTMLEDASGLKTVTHDIPVLPQRPATASASTLTGTTTVTWTNPSDASRVGLEVSVAKGGSEQRKVLAASATSTTFSSLASGSYGLKVTAYDEDGDAATTTGGFTIP